MKQPEPERPSERTRAQRTHLATAAAVGIVALLALVAGPGGPLATPVALAHTALETSIPADGDVVSTNVSEITLTFTEPVEPVANGFEVFLPSTEVVPVAPQTADGITFVITLDPPVYTGDVGVRYEVVSADGHPVTGSFSFVVDAPVPATTAMPTTMPTTMPTAVPTTVRTTVPTTRPVPPTDTAAEAPTTASLVSIDAAVAPAPSPDSPVTTTPTTALANVEASNESSSGVGPEAIILAVVVGVVIIGGAVALVARQKRQDVPPPAS